MKYLRMFVLWIGNLFSDKLSVNQAARELLYEREMIAISQKRIEECEAVLESYFKEKGSEAIVVENTKIYPVKRVSFDFGEDKDDKRKKAFTRSLTGAFYYKVPNYAKIAKALVDDKDEKVIALIDKYQPAVLTKTSIRIKHVHPTVDL